LIENEHTIFVNANKVQLWIFDLHCRCLLNVWTSAKTG